jgi:hypothetical protein
MSNKNTISYRNVNDYLIPNITLQPKEVSDTLSKWGMMHKTYLEKYKKVFFSSLLIQGKLLPALCRGRKPSTRYVLYACRTYERR